jgi:H+/Cl- antiporter ClcA
MAKENSRVITTRILKISIFFQILATVSIYFFTKSMLYCIINILAATIGILSFWVMIKLVDRYLKKNRGKFLFFTATFLKIIIISLVFYFLSRLSESAVLYFILGLSTIVISILIEGTCQIFRTASNGRT